MRTKVSILFLTAAVLATTAGAQNSANKTAAELKLAEAKVVSALPVSSAHGVAAEHFQLVWRSLERWETAVFVVMKAGHVFETYGKISSMVNHPSEATSSIFTAKVRASVVIFDPTC